MATSKRSKQGVPLVDRLSILLEPLLSHILSLLPTHNAVQTSILSKRWKNLWTTITSLHFDDEFFADPELPFGIGEENKRFEQFIYRVLLFLKTPFLQKFSLNCLNAGDPFHLNTWVSVVLSRDIRELALNILRSESFEIPISLFTCKTLSSLSLDIDLTLNVPNSVCLPKLKYIHLSYIKYMNDKSIPKLLSGCPALEDLSILRIAVDNVFHFNISAPTLKSLSIYSNIDIEPDSPQHILQIDAPLLQYLRLHDEISSDFVIGNVSSLTKADINVHVGKRNNAETGYGDEVLKLLNKLSHVKYLKLSGLTMKALSYARVHVAPDMQNLVRLEGHFCGYEQEGWCIQPDHVPIYLLSRLTAVVITNFKGSTNELEMVKFILNGAKTLQRMKISASHLEVKLNLLQEITMFPRASKLCDFVVTLNLVDL